jgi:hypothetical protein
MRARILTAFSLIVTLALLAGASGAQAQMPQPWRAEDSSAPQQQGHNVVLEGQIGGDTSGVAIQGQYAYIGVGPHLVILDIGDPAHPVLVGQTDPLPRVVFDVAVAGNYAYVAAFISGLRIIDISNPAEPVEVGSIEIWGNPVSVAVVGSYAYVVDLLAGLWIIDVSDPAVPVQVGHYSTPAMARGVAVAGPYAYLTDDGGLWILDISDPEAPTLAGTLWMDNAEGVAAAI